MSIANLTELTNFTVENLTVGNLNPTDGNALLIGNNPGSGGVRIGNGDDLNSPNIFFNGIEAAFVKVGNLIPTQDLKLGTDNTDGTTAVTIGHNTIDVSLNGARNIVNAGIETNFVKLGQLPVAPLLIGNDNTDNTSAVMIGNSSIPTEIYGMLQFPSLSPSNLIIGDSYESSISDSGFSGALVVANNAADVYFYKLGNWVTVHVRNKFTRAAPTANCLSGVLPIILTYTLPAEVRPTDSVIFMTGAYKNGTNDLGQGHINNAGAITVGSLDTNLFTPGQTCGIMDFSFTYLII